MINKKWKKAPPKVTSWREIQFQVVDHGKSHNKVQRTGANPDFQISDKDQKSLSTEISENANLMAQFFANDSLGG